MIKLNECTYLCYELKAVLNVNVILCYWVTLIYKFCISQTQLDTNKHRY